MNSVLQALGLLGKVASRNKTNGGPEGIRASTSHEAFSVQSAGISHARAVSRT